MSTLRDSPAKSSKRKAAELDDNAEPRLSKKKGKELAEEVLEGREKGLEEAVAAAQNALDPAAP
jgi:hypothetical protein